MSGSVNKVILIGNLGQDPETRSMGNGEVCNLSVATSESWKDKSSGERKERSQWHKVVIFNEPLIKVASSYLKKGSKVYIEGQLETRKWQDKEGKDQYTTEIVLRPFKGELTILESKKDDGPVADNSRSTNPSYGHGRAQKRAVDDMEDDIPFMKIK